MRRLTEIRPATGADAAAIARVHIQCWRENFRGLIDERALGAIVEAEWRERREGFLARPERRCLVALRDGEICGFGECGPVREERYGAAGEILSLFVGPAAQGAGMGRALFAALAAELTGLGYGTLVVKTMRDSPQSRAFYERQGCEWIGESSFEFAGKSYPEAVYRLAL